MIQLTSFNPAPLEHPPEEFRWIWPVYESRNNVWSLNP